MGSIPSSVEQTDTSSNDVVTHLPILRPILAAQFSDDQVIWNPAFNEFQFGDSPQNVNSNLPNQFASLTWENMPQASEFPDDLVKYIWLKLTGFGDGIRKFIPPTMTINETRSYVCFLFVNEKLFHISIRLFYDDKHRNYNKIIEAYANVVNTPIIDIDEGKEFYYEDNRIIYCSYSHADKSHLIIEVIRKDQIISDDKTYGHLSIRHQRRQQLSFEPLISSSTYKYDIMISYCHKDKELCHRLYYHLRDNKYRVWIDLENMYGPIVERMAEAIENTEFVLICMSNAYKSSSYCQLEAEYAFKFQSCLIPVVIKKDFTETGWLGMLCGLRLQVDFTKTTFETAYESLCTEIQRYRTQATKKIHS